MTALIENGLMNAPVALCLAGMVLLVGRFWKQPALLHALWVLVLLKLVMPPLIQVPVPWQLPAWLDASTQFSLKTQVADYSMPNASSEFSWPGKYLDRPISRAIATVELLIRKFLLDESFRCRSFACQCFFRNFNVGRHEFE